MSKIDTYQTKFGTVIGQGSKIGVNTTIIPGVKIGKNTFIGPSETIDSDLEENLFVYKGKKINNKIKA